MSPKENGSHAMMQDTAHYLSIQLLGGQLLRGALPTSAAAATTVAAGFDYTYTRQSPSV